MGKPWGGVGCLLSPDKSVPAEVGGARVCSRGGSCRVQHQLSSPLSLSGDSGSPGSSHIRCAWAPPRTGHCLPGRPSCSPLPFCAHQWDQQKGCLGAEIFPSCGKSPHGTGAGPVPPFLLPGHAHTPASDLASPDLSAGNRRSTTSSRAASALSEGHLCPSHH